MVVMNKKGIIDKRYLKEIIKSVNDRTLSIIGKTPILHGGRLLRKFKSKREVEEMKMNDTPINIFDDIEDDGLKCVFDIKEIIQKSMKENHLSPKEARKALGVKRYEE